MKPNLLTNPLRSSLWSFGIVLMLGLSSLGCEVTVGADKSESEADDEDDEPKKSKKKKKAKKDKDKSADEEDLDVNDLLDDSGEASGVLKTVDLSGLDTSKAPHLGRRAATKNAAIRDAQWLTLPGGRLQIPNPNGWRKKKEGNLGVLASPDKKALILFTTYRSKQEVVKKLDDIGKLAKVKSVKWKNAKTVRLGQDDLPALVRGGQAMSADGRKGTVLFALVETGAQEKVLAVSLMRGDVSKRTRDQAAAILVSTRKKR